MFCAHANRVAFLRFLITACLALLAGCNVPKPAALSSVAAPTNLTAIADNGLVTLIWTASSGATSYTVKRATNNGGPYAQLASPTSTTYADSSVTNGVTYYYVVSARDAAGEGLDSTQVTATPRAPTAAPAPPTNPIATPGNTQVSLTWTASSGATSYRVRRATVSGGPYTSIATTILTSYVDTALTNGTTYYYTISAINSVGESAPSTQVSATPSPPPPTVFGTWTDVTPSNVNLTSALCSNFGTRTVQADPARPSNLYAMFDCQGIWRSTDYGINWIGPINTGTNGIALNDCSGGIALAPGSIVNAPPTIYLSCIRGNSTGFWKSIDGGVSWISYVVAPGLAAPGGPRQDYSPPVIDPYDSNHLLMTAHEFDSLVESFNGGLTWSSVPLANGMLQTASNSTIFFVNTGSASTTRQTWLWTGNPSGGTYGTWRTVSSGASWTQVDKNEGAAQIYQPDNNGVVFMAGDYSVLGTGVLRSADYGQTWARVGISMSEVIVFGTSKNVYAMFGSAAGPGNSVNPNFQVATQPGTGTWVAPGTPAGLTQGPGQVSVVNNGTQNIFVGAMWNSGLWRYIEP